MNDIGLKYAVDIVLCIDATGSMRNLIDMVKKNALSLYNDIANGMATERKKISTFRVKVIAFRDYLADGENAMKYSRFFNLPEENELFQEVVNSIYASGGGDEPEDGLEALAYAMQSDWTNERDTEKRRQIIVVWTDASVHEIGFGKEGKTYPKNMVKDFIELSDMWGDEQTNSEFMDFRSKRLILFAPEEVKGVSTLWNDVADWDNTITIPSRAGEGLQDITYNTIISAIVNSV